MARKKAVENPITQEPQSEPAAPVDSRQDAPPGQDSSSPAAGPAEPYRSKWADRFNSWGDHEAGVTVIEDRQNRRMTIKFDEKPSDPVRKLMKEQHGYRYDGEDQVWYKRINPAKARQHRDEAEDVAFKAASLIRQEKGLEPKAGFNLGM